MSRIAELYARAEGAGATWAVAQPLRAHTWLHLRGGVQRRRVAKEESFAQELAAEIRRRLPPECGGELPREELRWTLELDGKPRRVGLRVASTAFGYTTTLRRAWNQLPWDLDVLGIPAGGVAALRRAVRERGVVLVAGRTMSGRSAVLYALLRELARAGRLAFSAEHYIHRIIPGVRQVLVEWENCPGPGGWAPRDVVRAARRSGADALMLAECSSWGWSVAEAAGFVQEGGLLLLNGRPVWDMGSALGRLAQHLGEGTLVGAPITVVRPLRIPAACGGCRHRAALSPGLQLALGLSPALLEELREEWPGGPATPREVRVARPRGCRACRHSGRSGFTRVYEVVRVEGLRGDEETGAIPAEACTRSHRGQVLAALVRGAILLEDALLALRG